MSKQVHQIMNISVDKHNISKKKKVVFVWPPYRFNISKAYGMPPLGILYLASNLKKNGHHVNILDLSLRGYSLEQCIKEILSLSPDYVGISVMTDRLFSSLLISQKLKEKNPNVKTLLGGAHINATGMEVMSELELGRYIDVSFTKESESTILQYISGDAPESIPGLVYRDKSGEVKMNPPVIPTSNLDELPFPDLGDIANVPAYFTPFFKKGPMTTMMATRGCPYTCSFCDVPTTMGKKYRTRSPENLIDEILFNKTRYSINNFSFKDSIFNLNNKNTTEFCELLLKKNLKINWVCNSRVDTIKHEMAKLMARSGCRVINFGVESLDPNVLALMNKRNTLEEIKRSIELIRKTGIASTAYMMVGNEGETYQSYMDGLRELMKLNPTLIGISITKAYPGTQLYQESLSKGLLKDAKWYHNFEKQDNGGGYLDLPSFAIKDQIKAAKESYKIFYFRLSKIIKLLYHSFSLQFIIFGIKFAFHKNSQHEL